MLLRYSMPIPISRSGRHRTAAARWLLVWALVAGGVAACDPSQGTGTEVVLDLVGEFEAAEPLVETSRLEIGRASARPLMITGWHTQDERWEREIPFVWSTGTHASVDLPLLAVRPVTLRFECRPFPRDVLRRDVQVPQQALTVVVNGWTAGTVKLKEGFHSYALDVPARAVRPGRNRVEFHALYNPETADYLPVPSPDGVHRTIAWASVGFERAWSIETPRADAAADELRLPFNTGLDYFARVPEGAALSLEGLSAWGEAPDPRLDVHISTDESSEPLTRSRIPSRWSAPEPVRLAEPTAPQLVRLTIMARANTEGETAGGLTLTAPRLVAPRPPMSEGEAPAARPAPFGGSPLPNVLIYLIDTLRADRLGVYGYDRETSPHLDALARDGIVFTNAQAQSSWTRTSVASLFTGLHPRSHNVNGRTDKLSPRALTLSTLLGASGYQTTGIITNGNVSKNFGFELGFDSYVHLREQRTREVHVLSDAVNARAVSWLDGRDPTRPFFLYLHTTDPHDPYTPRSPFRERFVPSARYPDLVRLKTLFEHGVPADQVEDVSHELSALYDAEIAFNDEQFGILVEELKRRDLYDQTIIIVVSDHGEEFQDHGGWGHGITLYREQLAVPLIVKLPGQQRAGHVVDRPAQHVDLMPTLLALLGLPIPPEVQGTSLWPDMAGHPPSSPGVSTAYLRLDGRALESLQREARKLIRHFTEHETSSRVELYDLAHDPTEQTNLAGDRPVLRGYLLAALRRWVSQQPSLLTAEEAVIDADLEERLRALGYIR